MDTVLHEILHSLYDHYELKENDPEERIVACLSHGLTRLFVDNPGLIKFIKVCT